MFRSSPQKMALLKYFKRIKLSQKERIQSVLPKPDGPLACLMPSLAIEATNSPVREIFTDGTINEDTQDSPTPEDSLATISKNIHKSFSFVYNYNNYYYYMQSSYTVS